VHREVIETEWNRGSLSEYNEEEAWEGKTEDPRICLKHRANPSSDTDCSLQESEKGRRT